MVIALLLFFIPIHFASTATSSQLLLQNKLPITASGAAVITGIAGSGNPYWALVTGVDTSTVISFTQLFSGFNFAITNLTGLADGSIRIGVQESPTYGYDATINLIIGSTYTGSADVIVNGISVLKGLCPSGEASGVGSGVGTCSSQVASRSSSSFVQFNLMEIAKEVTPRIPIVAVNNPDITPFEATTPNYDNGEVSINGTITWSVLDTFSILEKFSAAISFVDENFIYRQTTQVGASVTIDGKVTFKVNGKVIPGCKKRLVEAWTLVSCSYKPSTRGYITITTTFNPTDEGKIGTTASSARIFVNNRTGKRAG